MAEPINYAVEYARDLANAYPYLSYFPEVWTGPNSQKYKPVNGKTVMIPSMTTTGARAVNRDHIDGVFNRNFDNEYQAVTMSMDREWDTLVDPMDIKETNQVVTIANITKTFNEFQKVPEQDAYCASKLAGFAQSFGTVDNTTLTKDNILETWDGYLEYMVNQRINRDRLIAYMTPSVYKLLKEAAGITRFLDAGTGVRNVDRNVGKLDGIVIKEVPSDMMKTIYDFTTGWVIGSSAKQINLLLVDPMAVIAPIIYDTSMMSPPSAQSKGKWLYYERYYYDIFTLNKRRCGVLANIGEPVVGTLTVTSVAGASSGESVIAVAEKPVLGQKLVYQLNSADPSITYGQDLSSWEDLPADGVVDVTSETNVTVCLVNTTKGNGAFAVAEGNATIVKAS
ncbi:hypothetical protein [uncultured Traorella sp.]|uniref:hypothetical protein n=1 Tax=uncultured Traorella sp. TaxID=1929048 RepID=UPI0025CCB3C4|nr:hypothetical protein [uncultured Traorella sp.]